MPPRGKRGLSKRQDDYVIYRCRCGHLQYGDDVPGGKCRWCDCADHHAPEPPGGDAA